MRYLLDTHTLIWYFEDDSKLPLRTKSIIDNVNNDIFVSMATIWEIGIKLSIGKLTLPFTTDDIVARMFRESMNMIMVESFHITEMQTLPHHHRDPFDRMIIAQANCENCTVITKDPLFDDYDVDILW